MTARPPLLMLGPAPWHAAWQRPQHFATRLVKRGWRVVFVDPPFTLLSPFRDRTLWRQTRAGVLERQPGLIVLRPPLMLPFGNLKPAVSRANQRRLAQWLRRTLKRLGVTEAPLIFTYLPATVHLLPHLDHVGLVYDCADDHAAFPGLIDPAVVSALEDQLLAQANAVFASSTKLWQRCLRVAPAAQLLPNGADAQHFARALQPGPLPEDLARLSGPRIGYIGALGPWTWLEVFAAVGRSNPDASVVLLGPASTDLRPALSQPNVHWLGTKPYAQLPEYLRGFDLCLSAFRPSPLAEGVNPLKVYEYLAAGREVLSTPQPDLLALGEAIHFADSPAAFAASSQKLLAGQGRHDPGQLAALARRHSWDDRAAQIAATLEGWQA